MKKKWLVPALMGIVILLAVASAYFLSRPQGNELYAAIDLQATTQTPQGVDPGSSFALTSKWRVSEETLRGMLRIEPELGYTLSGRGKRWELKPGAPLSPNLVYTVCVTNPATGETVQSFAFQTRSDLLVNSVYPGNDERYVPVESGIEVTFNAANVNLQGFFEVKPEVAGSFEQNGNTSLFRPAEPLTGNSIYRVTLKAGLTAPGGQVLREDYSFTFETANVNADDREYTRLQLAGEYAESFLPGDPLVIEMNAGEQIAQEPFLLKLYRYADISGYRKELQDHDAFYEERYGEKTEYVANTTGLEEVLSQEGPLVRYEDWGAVYALLPDDLPEGWYIATISGKNSNGEDEFVQKLLQLQNLSLYTQSQDGETLLWLNNPVSGQPMGKVPLVLEDVKTSAEPGKAPVVREAVTQQDGTARLKTGKSKAAYLSATEDGKVIYFDRLRLAAEEEPSLPETFYTACYTDRALYQPDDTIRFWGVARPRAAKSSLPSAVWVTLTNTYPRSEIYRLRVPVAADGTFTGELPITGLQADWYNFEITDGEEGVYSSQSLQVERFTKPAYLIDVTTDKEVYNLNEPVTFQISAHFYDGTPAAGIELYFSGAFPEAKLKLDENGRITHTSALDVAALTLQLKGMPWTPREVFYNLYSGGEEAVQVSTYGAVTMLPSRVAAKIESEDPSELTIYTAALDTARLDERVQPRPLNRSRSEYDTLAGAPVELPVSVLVHKSTYIKVPVGSYYDYINKRTVNRYESKLESRVVDTLKTTTVGGVITLSELPYSANTPEEFYWFELQFDGGVLGEVKDTFYYFSHYGRTLTGKEYSFTDDNAPADAAIGDELTLGLYENGVKKANQGRVLYSVLQSKTLAVGVYTGNAQKLTMEDAWKPNVAIVGAYFDGRHIYTMNSYQVSYDYAGQKLKLTLTPDKPAYRPGETAKVAVEITDAAGNPVEASACVGVVDEAIFDLVGQEVDLAAQIYQNIYYPSVASNVNYRSYLEAEDGKAAPNAAAGDLLNTGGGGNAVIFREKLVDTALFQTVRTDAAGKAAIELPLPDNVTSWRITALAVTDDLKAGESVTNSVATLPFYLRLLCTDSYLEGDDVTVSLGGVGTEVSTEESVSYTLRVLDSEGRLLDQLTGTGKAGERTPFNFGKYSAGSYTLEVQGSCSGGSDGLRQPFSVVKKAATAPVLETLSLDELAGLQSLRYPVNALFYDERMETYLSGLVKLSAQSGERTERIAASYRAQVLFNELLAPEQRQTIHQDSRLSRIQDPYGDGSAKALPVGGADPAVTAKLLVACPELLNKTAAGNYLKQLLKDPAATQNDRVMAYLGLASLKEPLLIDLNRILKEETLTDAQRLYLGVGLAQLGDFTGAERIYAALGNKLKSEGTLKYVEIDGSVESRLEATGAALMLTSITSNPDAEKLMNFLCVPENDRSRSDKVLCDLEMLCYLENFTVPVDASSAKFSFVENGASKEITLSNPAWYSAALSAETMRTATFKTLSGNVRAAVSYTAYAEELTLTDNELVTVTKTYTPTDDKELAVAGRVKVEIKLHFDQKAPYGCYNVTDYIPSGMRWMGANSNPFGDRSSELYADMENEDQVVRGYIYRSAPAPVDPAPLQEVQVNSAMIGEEIPIPVGNHAPADTKVIPRTDGEQGSPTEPTEPPVPENNDFTLTYYLTAVMPGNFIAESVYVTPQTEGVAAKSPRDKLTILPKKES